MDLEDEILLTFIEGKLLYIVTRILVCIILDYTNEQTNKKMHNVLPMKFICVDNTLCWEECFLDLYI